MPRSSSVCTTGCKIHILPFHGSTTLVDLGLHYKVHRSHSNTPQSTGLLWTSDRPIADTSTWQQTTLTRDRHSCTRRDSNPQSQQAGGRRRRGRRNRREIHIKVAVFFSISISTKLLFQRPHSSRSGQAVAKLAPWAKKIYHAPTPHPTHIGQFCNFRLRISNVHALQALLSSHFSRLVVRSKY